jgi:hypothetical protein
MPPLQKTHKCVHPGRTVRLPTVPRARALQCPRAGPCLTAEHLTGRIREEKVTHVLPHAHWTDMV